MIVYPAIDLRGGQVVRLREGDPSQQTVFSSDPVATANRWRSLGADWIHMVNLDGALNQANDNLEILKDVAQLPVRIQFGGGVRTLDDIDHALELGASRVVLGTIAARNPEILHEAIPRFGAERLCVALDAKDGKVAVDGWQNSTDLTPRTFGQRLAQMGVVHALFTDVKRDGRLQGVAAQETIALAQTTGLQVIASGGVASLTDIRTLAESNIVAGAIIGMALYTNKISLDEALREARGNHAG